MAGRFLEERGMKWGVFVLGLCLCGSGISRAQKQPVLAPDAPAIAQQAVAPQPQAGVITGTVTDVNAAPVPSASVALEGPALNEPRTVVTGEDGVFEFKDLAPGTPYRVTISAKGFNKWASAAVILNPGQTLILTGSQLQIAEGHATVTVYAYSEEIATEQVKIEEQQRVFGFIPNFYIAYDPNAMRLSTKLKFRLAFRVAFDPITFLGAGAVAGVNQAADFPKFGQGAKGYGQRFGAAFTDTFTDTMIGGAILPSLLHQDPRYFYQGTGSTKSRILHALSQPFVCKGDNGQRQPNYSSLGGDLASAAISNTYYPASNRATALMFENFLIDTGDRMASTLLQEFILRRLTPKARK